MTFERPNYTQVPNFFIRTLMAEASGAETKIMLLILTYTIGFHREQGLISLNRLIRESGLSRPGVCKTIKSLEEKNWIAVTRATGKSGDLCNKYKINLVEEKIKPEEEGVNPIDPPEKEGVNSVHGGGKLTLPERGNSVNPLKKEKETIRKKLFVAEAPVGAPLGKIKVNNGTETICLDESQIYRKIISEGVKWSADEIKYTVETLAKYTEVVHDWWGFLKGTVERYRNKRKSEKASQGRTQGSPKINPKRGISLKCEPSVRHQKKCSNNYSENDTSEPALPELVCLGTLLNS